MSNKLYFAYMVLFLIECAAAQADNNQALFISYLILMTVASIVRFLYYIDEDA
jgi:hypothetical protein